LKKVVGGGGSRQVSDHLALEKRRGVTLKLCPRGEGGNGVTEVPPSMKTSGLHIGREAKEI